MMGYYTSFDGSIEVTAIDEKAEKLMEGLARTRRMKRKLPDEYGIEGEFYVDGGGFCGQDRDDTVLDYNSPPSTQPGLWLPWEYNDGKLEIPEQGKHYEYIEWLVYLRDRIIVPAGGVMNGLVDWYGEDRHDTGRLQVVNNVIHVYRGRMSFRKESTL